MEVLPRSDRGQIPDTEDLNSIPSDLEIEKGNNPDGPTFPLNSKWLNAAQIRQLIINSYTCSCVAMCPLIMSLYIQI